MPPAAPHRALPLLLAAFACAPEPDPLRIAVLLPRIEGSSDLEHPVLEWARANVNAAGGAAGRPLEFEYYDGNDPDLAALGERLATDGRYVAVIGPGSAALQTIAVSFINADRPIVSPLSTSDDLLRAHGAKGAIWRTRESDIAQAELLVRYAHDEGAERIALLASLDVGGYSFFSWFGFFAAELGYPEDRVEVVAVPAGEPCEARLAEVLGGKPEILFVAPSTPDEVRCVIRGLPPAGLPRPRVVFADTGLDPYVLETIGEAAVGVEGFVGAADHEFAAAFAARYPDLRLAPHGASEYDAVLLLAYGLEIAGGATGQPLIDALKAAVDGDAESPNGWDADGIAATLAALGAGERPRLRGATGPLKFEPDLYMDLASYTYSRWQIDAEGLTLHERHNTGDPSFLTSAGALVRPTGDSTGPDDSTWTPKAAKADTWALIAALSPSWSNYRHQADALQQYRLLRAGGVPDDHIVLVLADDLADDPQNPLPGVVRNAPRGDDLHGDLEIDYGLTLTADDLADILTGTVTDRTPNVLATTAASNLYVYLAGHGGTDGIPIDADSAAAGIAGGAASFSPTDLRAALCALQDQDRLRRGLVVIESCFSGAFGDPTYDGLELGCGADATPLAGVVLMTAANSREVSFAGAFDDEVASWVNDAFSRRFAEAALAAPDVTLADLYTDVYRGTAGSHPSLYNTNAAGKLGATSLAEFFTP